MAVSETYHPLSHTKDHWNKFAGTNSVIWQIYHIIYFISLFFLFHSLSVGTNYHETPEEMLASLLRIKSFSAECDGYLCHSCSREFRSVKSPTVAFCNTRITGDFLTCKIIALITIRLMKKKIESNSQT